MGIAIIHCSQTYCTCSLKLVGLDVEGIAHTLTPMNSLSESSSHAFLCPCVTLAFLLFACIASHLY